MENTYWSRQAAAEPLFPDMLWSRPENRQAAGKLLIIGGNAYGFAAPAEAYQESLKAGVGTTRVIMPVSIKKIAGRMLETIDYAPSTISGSFSKAALAEFMDHATWADGTLIAGDLGRNSETAVAIESFLTKNSAAVTLVKDAADYGISLGETILKRPNTFLTLTIAQLQKLFTVSRQTEVISFSMDLVRLVDALHKLTEKYPASIIVKHLSQLVVANQGQISTTAIDVDNEDFWRIKTATHTAVWWLQNPDKPFEAATSAVGLLSGKMPAELE